jgi:hypothetical protein
MTITRQQIGNTLIEIQSYFLAQPGPALTAEGAGRRFGRSVMLSCAVLDLLADAGVLDRSPDGTYSRRLPGIAPPEPHRIRRAPRAVARTAA